MQRNYPLISYNRIFEQGKSTFINFNFPIFPHPLPSPDVINTNVPCNNNNNGDKYLWLGRRYDTCTPAEQWESRIACNCVISIIQKSIPAEWCYPSSVNESGVTLPGGEGGRAENDKVGRAGQNLLLLLLLPLLWWIPGKLISSPQRRRVDTRGQRRCLYAIINAT